MSDIKLFVCCHKPSVVPEHPLLVPVQVGAALADKHFPGFAHDDTGENISAKNRSYCELTAQYWAWKNVEAEHYGFFHYRRYLYPDAREKRPYQIQPAPSVALLDKLGYDGFASVIGQYDLLLPVGEDMHISVREHFAHAPFQHKKDLDLVEAIIRENWPDYVPAMEAHLSGTVCYFGNIYIMKRQVFHDYCAWLFAILEEFDRRADLTGYAEEALRVNGYLAERLFGVYYTHHRELLALELPRIHFEDAFGQRMKKKAINLLLPPGTKRRAAVKRFI